MKIVSMRMSDYKVEADDPATVEYGDEVLCAGWNPCLALQPCAYTEPKRQTSITIDLAGVDAEMFLKKMYAYQR